MRQLLVGEFANQNKAQNYPKQVAVDLTGVWGESLRSYPGRSVKQWTEGEAPPEGARVYSDICSFNRSQPKP
jgi:hypothetical protein